MTTKLYVPVAEAAAMAGVSADTIRKWLRSTSVPFITGKKAGKKVLISVASLEEALASLPDA